jgi:hypothetical protein
MGLQIQLQFFQAAATALPTIFIAFALTSRLLDPASRRNLKIDFVLLSGKSGIVTLAILVIGFVAAEMMTLIVLATDTPTFPVFVMVSFFLFLFALFVGLQALNPLLQNAAAAAEMEASGEAAKAAAIGKYRTLGNVIIIGSFAFLLAGAVIFYVMRAQH